MKLENLPEGALKLINDLFNGLEALGDNSIAVVMAMTKVGDNYGHDKQPINVVYGGPQVDHRVYGDMVMAISHDIHNELNLVVTDRVIGGGVGEHLQALLKELTEGKQQ